MPHKPVRTGCTGIDIIDKMKIVSVTGFKNVNESTSAVSENVPMTKAEKKQRFMQSAGKIRIDAKAVSQLRERIMPENFY